MNHFGLFIFVLLCKICILMDLVYSSSLETNLDKLKREYGEGYGTEWVYFPDGAVELHYINLSMTMEEALAMHPKPVSSTPDQIQFRLYNGKNSHYISLDNRGRAVNYNEQDTTNYIMRLHLPLKIITHGWRSSANIEDILNIKDAYLAAQNVNVITVDWNPAASNTYAWAVSDTKRVGSEIASFLDGLNEEYGVTGDMLHLIGHSLGAHVVGTAASQTKSKVHRVTGLDPAKPFFELLPFATTIAFTNAEIVDVIHTCAGVLGIKRGVGTVDFYPNGGTFPQPGCKGIMNIIHACSHSIAMYYFKESIKYPEIYPAYKCKSWKDLKKNRCNHNYGYKGDGVNKDMTGTHYLKTNGRESYIFPLSLIKKHVPQSPKQKQPYSDFTFNFNLRLNI